MQHDPGTRPTASPDRSAAEHAHRAAWVDSVPVAVLVAVTAVLAVLVGVVLSASEPSVAAGAAPAPSPSAASTQPAAAAPPPPVAPAAEVADLRAEAARLTSRLPLTAPAAWARWGATRASYPHDVDGCPSLAARLGAALGTAMRYREGTLPAGPYGCTWVPASSTAEPYTYGGQAGEAYRLDVGWLADGTSTETLRSTAYEHGDRTRCPGAEVPAVAAGAVLVRCEEESTVEYTLALPDTRAPGVWLLHALVRDDARRTPAQALDALVEAARHAYG